MGKATKKKKDKAADFSKKKLKLGKGKQVASNAIDTSFKARSIALPSQSILVTKSADTPLTKRRQSLDDLVGHLKHYNPSTRKDALIGLRELLDNYPHLIELHLVQVVNACVRMISDEDASVRKALLAFFGWLLPLIPSENLTAHTSALLLFTSSAQTHIFPEIRLDATRLLTLLLEYMPDTVVAGWSEKHEAHGSRILQGYLGILNAGTRFDETQAPVQATSTASVVLSPASKLVVMQSLSNFLRHAISQDSAASSPGASTSTASPSSQYLPIWFFRPFFTCEESYQAFAWALQPSQAAIRSFHDEQEEDDCDFVLNCPLLQSDHSVLLSQFSELTAEDLNFESDAEDQLAFISHLSRSLYPTLRSIFLDYAPSVFSPSSSPPEPDLSLISAVISIAHTLYGALLRHSLGTAPHGDSIDNLRSLITHMSPYFPFTPSGARDLKIEQSFQAMNLSYCEMCSLVVSVSQSQQHLAQKGSKRPRKTYDHSKDQQQQSSLEPIMAPVRTYVGRLLRGEPMHDGQLGQSLSPALYISLLPTAWSLLTSTSSLAESEDMFHTLVEHACRTSSKSAVKKHTIELIARLVLLEKEPEYRGPFRISSSPRVIAILDRWITSLPQSLWELGSRDAAATELILRFLLRAVQRNSSLLSPKTVTDLQSRLAPFFSIVHPARGVIMGPFSTFAPISESSPRKLALDLVYTLLKPISRRRGVHRPSEQPDSAKTLVQAVDRAVEGLAGEEMYWATLRARI